MYYCIEMKSLYGGMLFYITLIKDNVDTIYLSERFTVELWFLN
jgi:hypothetical protein